MSQLCAVLLRLMYCSLSLFSNCSDVFICSVRITTDSVIHVIGIEIDRCFEYSRFFIGMYCLDFDEAAEITVWL